MQEKMVVQGRLITPADISQISDLLTSHPDWSQWKLSRHLCQLWQWHNDRGVLKDMACRSLLKKLEGKGYIKLPASRRKIPKRMSDRSNALSLLPALSKATSLDEAMPIDFEVVKSGSFSWKLFSTLLARYHYLGYKGSVGEHIGYLLWDKSNHPPGCILFGAAAWKIRPRDHFIGWTDEERKSNLHKVANNMRFLLLSQVPNLASYALGQISGRIREDFLEKYGHKVVLLETFVEVGRFRGTCYQASNWIYVGETQGRSRNDIKKNMKLPRKQIYLYPLEKRFRQELRFRSS